MKDIDSVIALKLLNLIIPLHKCQLTYSGKLKIKKKREPQVSYGLTKLGQNLIVVLDQIEVAHKWYAQEQSLLETGE